MTGLNFRGMKESILVLLLIFLGFVVLHLGLIIYGVAVHGDHLAAVVPGAVAEAHTMSHTLGPLVVIALLMRAFSLGGGTYTGLEAVSNNVNMLAEPRVPNGKVTCSTWRRRWRSRRAASSCFTCCGRPGRWRAKRSTRWSSAA
jgi:hypothetical protein